MHKPSVLHNNNILVLDNINKHNKAERRLLQHQFFESSLPSDAPGQRVARVVDNERKRDYLCLLAELHDANDPIEALRALSCFARDPGGGRHMARSCEKSPCEHRVT